MPSYAKLNSVDELGKLLSNDGTFESISIVANKPLNLPFRARIRDRRLNDLLAERPVRARSIQRNLNDERIYIRNGELKLVLPKEKFTSYGFNGRKLNTGNYEVIYDLNGKNADILSLNAGLNRIPGGYKFAVTEDGETLLEPVNTLARPTAPSDDPNEVEEFLNDMLEWSALAHLQNEGDNPYFRAHILGLFEPREIADLLLSLDFAVINLRTVNFGGVSIIIDNGFWYARY